MLAVRCTILLLFAGCTAAAVDRNPAAPQTSLSLAASSVHQQVTGHANLLLPQFNNVEEKYSQSAIRHADGAVSGEFILESAQDGGPRLHGHVVCFTIIGNAARLAGQIDQSNFSITPAGSYVVWSLRDNGEGAKDPPDETQDFLGPMTAAEAAAHCAVGLDLGPFIPVRSGNLQVHP
jgi:hypothetical protein